MLRCALLASFLAGGVVSAVGAQPDGDRLVRRWGQCSRAFADQAAALSEAAPREVAGKP